MQNKFLRSSVDNYSKLVVRDIPSINWCTENEI